MGIEALKQGVSPRSCSKVTVSWVLLPKSTLTCQAWSGNDHSQSPRHTVLAHCQLLLELPTAALAFHSLALNFLNFALAFHNLTPSLEIDFRTMFAFLQVALIKG
eukprot:COSAG02_NODE_1576_length_11868_cov_82.967117_8_plen_105_part_00